ncbi:MAG: ice-binding family protein [Thermoplasmata archaeon]
MAVEHTRASSRVVSVLVAVAMLFAALVAMAPLTTGPPMTPGIAHTLSDIGAIPSLASTCGQSSVPLGSAAAYAVLAGAGVTNTGPSTLTGDLGAGPGSSVTGFPPGTYTGMENVANAASAGAEANLTIAFNNASGRSNCAVTLSGNIGGQTLTPGLYTSTSTLAISSGDLTLNGGGNPNAVFVFQVASGLTTTSGRAVLLTNGAQAGNIYWAIGSSATLGTTSTMQGTVMAYASITMATGSHLNGRALARTGDVTLSDSTIVVPITTSSATYGVTFTESGLPAGTSWSVSFDGVRESSTAATIGFTVTNGTYAYTVEAVAGYTAQPSYGSVTVSGAAAGEAIAFTTGGTPETFTVTFTEFGLVSGTSWSIAFNGVLRSSTTATVAFTVANGTYTYVVGPVVGFTPSPSAGSAIVSGVAVRQAIIFTSGGALATFAVTFTESGLVSGTNWSVTFNGVPESSTTATVGFTETNGSYYYTVGAASGYTANPLSGNVTVSGATVSLAIAFTSTSGSGSSSPATSAFGIPWWGWVGIGIAVVVAAAAIGAGMVRSRRGKKRAP